MKSSVRFNEEVIVHQDQEETTNTESSSSSSTWMSPIDFSNIQNGVFITLDRMKLQEDRGNDSFRYQYNSTLSSYHCSRGLEDYHTEQKGCLKLSTIQRRQNAIDAVLSEQESQRRQQQQQQQQHTFYNYNFNYNYMNFILDDVKISQVYQNQTYYNVKDAIEMGGRDSEDALTVYSERDASSSSPQSQPYLSSQTEPEQEPLFDITKTYTTSRSRSRSSNTVTNLFQHGTTPQKQWSFTGRCVVAPTMNNHPGFA